MEKSRFALNQEIYEKELKQDLDSTIEPQFGLLFSFNLPFQLPFKDGTRFKILYDNHAIVFYFDKFSDTGTEPLGEGHQGVQVPRLRTRVEMLALTVEKIDESDMQGIYSYFIHLLKKLNNYIYAYKTIAEDWKTYRVAPENLMMSVVSTQLLSLPKWEELAFIPLMVNQNYEHIIFNLKDDDLKVVEYFGYTFNTSDNPFVQSRKSFADARTNLLRGGYQESVIHSQIAIESLLFNIYRLVQLDQGKGEKTVEEGVLALSFMSLVKKEISQILGGNWRIDDQNTPVSNWYKHVYLLRNRIVHGGYDVEQHESYSAFGYAYEMCAFIQEKINDKKNLYPEMAQLFQDIPEFFLTVESDDEGTWSID